MPKKRPVSITVFAILNFVFGGLGLLCNCCGLASPALQNIQPKQDAKMPFNPQEMQKHLEAKVPGYAAFIIAEPIIGLSLSIILILGGFGLLGLKPFARWTCISYCIITIVVKLASLVYSIAYVNPALDEWLRQQQGPEIPAGVYTAASLIGAMIAMAYAIALLIFILLPNTARALAAGQTMDFEAQTTTGEDYYDEDFERRRRDVPPDSFEPK